MRRFLLTSFAVLALIIGAAPAAHAADCTTDGQSCTPPGGGTGTCVSDDSGGLTCTSSVGTVINIDPTTTKGLNDYKTTTDEAYDGIMARIMSLFAWLVGVAAIVLDYAVYYTVVTMGNYVNDLSAIGVTWSILRDIGNIFLIFGFLAVGITTILNVDWYGGGKKMLPMMFVAAIFLNFSLFITEAVIDTGNLFATQFYTQINGGNPAGIKSFDPGSLSVSNEGISNKIMGQLGLQTIYGDAITNKKVFEGGAPWFIGFMGIILFIVTAFVLFSLAFVLIARFVILIFLIILAPVGFAGLAVPQLASIAKKWWDKLFEQTITAPVLLLMLYIALTIITDVRFLTGFGIDKNGPQWLGFITGGNLSGFASMMLSFLVAMGLLLAVVIFAKNLSAFGASKASQLAGKLTFGATAWGARATVGTGIGRGLLGNRFIKRAAVSDNALIKYGSRALSFTGKRLQSRTFDVRNMPGAQAGLGAMTIDAGTPSALTAKDLQEKQYGWKPVKEFFRQSDIQHEQAAEELKRKAALAGTDNDEITRALSKMTTKEIEELGGIKNGVEKLVNNLSPQQFEALMKSDKLSEVEKNRIKTTRYKPLDDAVGSGSATDIKKVLGNMSKSELESMPPALLATSGILDNLSDKQRDTLTDSKERTAGEKKMIKGASKVGKLEEVFNTVGAGAASALVAGLNKQQAAKLDRNVLVNPAISTVLTPDMLRAILREDKLIPADLAIIKRNVLGGGLLSSITYLNTGPDHTLWP